MRGGHGSQGTTKRAREYGTMDCVTLGCGDAAAAFGHRGWMAITAHVRLRGVGSVATFSLRAG